MWAKKCSGQLVGLTMLTVELHYLQQQWPKLEPSPNKAVCLGLAK